MTFREATDALLELGCNLEEIAKAIGCSVASVKQARMDADADGYRSPPSGWREGVEDLARKKERLYRELSGEL